MNTKLLWILIVVVIVLIGAWFAFGRTEDMPLETATTTPTTVLNDTTAAPGGETVTVTYTDEGFSPQTVTVAVGDTVRFVNNSGSEMWVAADEHPTHTSYDGTPTRDHCADGVNTTGSFDQCARVGAGTSWSYTFTKAGSFDYHNHARAADGGTITVQ
jgi:plastocyanin